MGDKPILQPALLLSQHHFNQAQPHKNIFYPFEPVMEAEYRQQCRKNIHEEQVFQNLSIVFKEQPNRKISQDEQMQAHSGEIQYVYRFNQQCLDILDWGKGFKYRFILNPSEKQGIGITTCIKLRRRLLIIAQQGHVYIHDLVRHNCCLTKSIVVYNVAPSSIFVVSSLQNQHHICTVQPMRHKKRPTLELKMHTIDMANNFAVRPPVTKQVRISEQVGSIVQHCFEDCGDAINVYAKVDNCLYIGALRAIMGEGCDNFKVQFRAGQVDYWLVENCSPTYQQRYSEIRSSWVELDNGQQKVSLRKSVSHQAHQPYLLRSTASYWILYKPSATELILTLKSPEQQPCETRVIEHGCPILQVIRYRDELVYLLDGQGCVWEYDFQQYEEDLLGWTHRLVLDAAGLQGQSREMEIKCCGGGRIAIVVDGAKVYISYPLLMPLWDSTNQQHHRSTFLSMQSSQFQDRTLLLVQGHTNFNNPNISPFLSLTSNQMKMADLIHFSIMPILGKYFSAPCQPFKEVEISWSLQAICTSIKYLKANILGTIHDNEDNNFYWTLSELCTGKYHQDIKSVVTTLLAEQPQNTKLLEILLNQHRLLKWLLAKCKDGLYPILCTTDYRKCRLKVGCPCVFKRIISQIIGRGYNFVGSQFFQGNYFFLKYKNKLEVVNLFLQNDQEALLTKIQSLADKQEQKTREMINKKKQKIIQQIDSKWCSFFGTEPQTIKQQSQPQQKPNIFNFTVDLKEQPTPQKYHITYSQSQQYQNQLYRSTDGTFVEKILLLQQRAKIITKHAEEEMAQLMEGLQKACRESGLLYSKSSLKEQQKEAKVRKCIIAMGCFFRLYQHLTAQPGLLRSKQNLRELWIAILLISCQALCLRYRNLQQTRQIAEMAIKFIRESSFLPAMVILLGQIDSLPAQQKSLLIESVYKVQQYRFGGTCTKQLSEMKYNYTGQVWEKGVSKLIKLYHLTKC